jgi:hypothetical protein
VVSEHDADWHEAEIEVRGVAKGDKSVKNITVIFPNSEDHRWMNEPKFREEQSKVFFLHKDQIADPAVRGALLMSITNPAPPQHHGGSYTALQKDDVEDVSKFAAVKQAAQHH